LRALPSTRHAAQSRAASFTVTDLRRVLRGRRAAPRIMAWLRLLTSASRRRKTCHRDLEQRRLPKPVQPDLLALLAAAHHVTNVALCLLLTARLPGRALERRRRIATAFRLPGSKSCGGDRRVHMRRRLTEPRSSSICFRPTLPPPAGGRQQ
jgi:hypothetical protein